MDGIVALGDNESSRMHSIFENQRRFVHWVWLMNMAMDYFVNVTGTT